MSAAASSSVAFAFFEVFFYRLFAAFCELGACTMLWSPAALAAPCYVCGCAHAGMCLSILKKLFSKAEY
ncbi:hypothetical protein Y032_0017g3268 [Ancylostoma ceylanicum]|uniref:Uncharacterized protein n=1 Tax=Ancylostoma ceylanicum TaxID=53326 RepID=A0A016V5K7_9BILA|nr:hypothetical protein Y032_0017g3268 [Ancylostoma ceylanicum]